MSEDSLPVAIAPSSSTDQPAALRIPSQRSRWQVTVFLAFVFGLAGAAIVFMAVEPEFESTMTLRVAPVLPKVMFETPEHSEMPAFDSYIQTQCALLTSRRVVDRALSDAKWIKEGSGYIPDKAENLLNNLHVTQPKGSQLILLSFKSDSPARAQAGARSVVDSYMQIYGYDESEASSQAQDVLETRLKTIKAKIDQMTTQSVDLADEYGPAALGKIHDAEVDNLLALGRSLDKAQAELINAPEQDSSENEENAKKRLGEKIRLLQQSYHASSQKVKDLGTRRQKIDELQAELSQEQERLAHTQSRLDQLQTESFVSGRITLLNEAELPADMSNRHERTVLMFLAGFGGVLLGLAVGLGRKKPDAVE